ASLKGNKIGSTQSASATDTAANLAVRHLGLQPSTDVTKLNIGSAPNILAAIQNGAVDAGVLSSPTNLQTRAAGMHELVNVANIGDPFPSGWAAASKKYVSDHQDAVQAYVKSIAEAVAVDQKNPEQAQQLLDTYT